MSIGDVTITNRQLSRAADANYIEKNLSSLATFTDISRHWAYYNILESSNTHNAAQNSDKEVWVKK